jgi:hypothetical protein
MRTTQVEKAGTQGIGETFHNQTGWGDLRALRRGTIGYHLVVFILHTASSFANNAKASTA